MSSKDISNYFHNFGNKMVFITILTSLSFFITLFSLIYFIIIINLKNYFTSVLIGYIILLLDITFRIILLIKILNASKEFKNINSFLGNFELQKFRSKIIIGSILHIFWYIIAGYVYFLILIWKNFPTWLYFADYLYFNLLIVTTIFYINIFIIIAIFEIKAWNSLKYFFSYKKESFPTNIGNSVRIGINFYKIIIIFELIFVFWFLADILRIIGFYKLMKLRNLNEGSVIIAPTFVKKFCENCGNPLKINERFCSSCGFKI